MSDTATQVDEFEALLARAEEANKAVPAGAPVTNVLPGQTAAPTTFDVDRAKRALAAEFDNGTVERAFAPLLKTVEEQQKLVSGLQQELARRDSEAYIKRVVDWAQGTGDARYGRPGQPLTPEEEANIQTLHKVASVILDDSIKASKADTSGATKQKSWDEAMSAAQAARSGKSGAIRAVQQSVQARHQARTFTPQATNGSTRAGGDSDPRREGIAAIQAIIGR